MWLLQVVTLNTTNYRKQMHHGLGVDTVDATQKRTGAVHGADEEEWCGEVDFTFPWSSSESYTYTLEKLLQPPLLSVSEGLVGPPRVGAL